MSLGNHSVVPDEEQANRFRIFLLEHRSDLNRLRLGHDPSANLPPSRIELVENALITSSSQLNISNLYYFEDWMNYDCLSMTQSLSPFESNTRFLNITDTNPYLPLILHRSGMERRSLDKLKNP